MHTMPLGLEISCKAGLLFLNVFSGDPFFDVLIIELLQSCLFMDQALAEVV